MKEKEILYNDLCQDVRRCTVCQNVKFAPYSKNSDCFIPTQNPEDNYVNLWNRWQHSLDAEIMVIGQDYGFYDEEFFKTDVNLNKMFIKTFGINIQESNHLLFFTNIANCYRKNKSTGVINKGCLALCANKFMSRLIKIVSPKIIIALGQATFEALAFCENAKLVCDNPSENNVGDRYMDVIGFDYRLQFEDGKNIAVFPVYHPGTNGIRNRNEQEQFQDWERIFRYAEELGLNISKFKGKKHLVYHRNMYGPSCEVASVNNKEDFKIYCYRENKVCIPNCNGCLYWAGDEMGKGMCCNWEEYYSDVFKQEHIVQHRDVQKEFKRVNKLKAKPEFANNSKNHIVTECSVNVYLNEKYTMTLGVGVPAVIKFSDLVDKGNIASLKIEQSFNCNRIVYLDGEALMQFVAKEYPEKMEQAKECILDIEAIYKIDCYDIS